MKKMIFSAAAFAVAAVSAIAVAPQSAEAIPAFARQTGAACLSCHFQSFPTLSAFGRSFKYSGFTDVGEQALVEDDGLSIPSSLNASVVLRPQFSSAKVTTAGVSTTTKGATIPADQVLLIAGRVTSNMGAFIEIGFGVGGGFANFQMINSYDLGGMKAGLSIYNSGFGETAGMETSSVFGQHGGMLQGKSISAVNTIGSLTGTGGVALWAANDMFNASVGLISDSAALGGVDTGFKLAPLVRAFVTPEFGGWELGVGVGYVNGGTGNATTIAALNAPGAPAAGLLVGVTALKMKKQFVDVQVQGGVGDVQLGFYADYATAKASTATEANLYNLATTDLKGYSARATVKPLHNVVAILGYGVMDNGAVGATVAKAKTMLFGAEYELAQNFVVALTNSSTTGAGFVSGNKNNTWLLDIEALM